LQSLQLTPVASVQNRFNHHDRSSEKVLELCAQRGIPFLPWGPIQTGEDAPLQEVAAPIGATPAQVALAWLLHRSPVILPIPGTSSVAHLEENAAAAAVRLDATQLARLQGSTP
jgi:aryl-alcohol dehydrogenase-like predicted oxidoreductase